MLTLSNLEKSYGAQLLFKNVNLQFNLKQKYGIVGANGSGKSTLLKIINSSEDFDCGKVSLSNGCKIGSLKQDQFTYDNEIIINFVMKGDDLRFKYYELMKTDSLKSDFNDIYENFEKLDCYRLKSEAASILEGLGLRNNIHEHKIDTLSGGFRLRVLLARLLLSNVDILLLDEPTNHLDLLSVKWLKIFLLSYSGCLLVVSHDVDFLNSLCTFIVDIDHCNVTLYRGNYLFFKNQKLLNNKQLEKKININKKYIERKQLYIDRFGSKSSKSAQANSIKKQIKKIKIEELPTTSKKHYNFKFNFSLTSSKNVLTLKKIKKSFNNKLILNDVSINVSRGEHVAFIGSNGVGKSTLMKILANELICDSGDIIWGSGVEIGYFSQNLNLFKGNDNVNILNWLWKFDLSKSENFIRNILGSLSFNDYDINKNILELSGGEAAKLNLARLIIQGPNVLILDEVTNHLDLKSISSLMKALKDYKGTLLFVSHNHLFIKEIATKIIDIKFNTINEINGNFDEYLSKNFPLNLIVNLRNGKNKLSNAKIKSKEKYNQEKENQKRDVIINSILERKIIEIEKLELILRNINIMFSNQEFYKKKFFNTMKKMQIKQDYLNKKIENIYIEIDNL